VRQNAPEAGIDRGSCLCSVQLDRSASDADPHTHTPPRAHPFAGARHAAAPRTDRARDRERPDRARRTHLRQATLHAAMAAAQLQLAQLHAQLSVAPRPTPTHTAPPRIDAPVNVVRCVVVVWTFAQLRVG